MLDERYLICQICGKKYTSIRGVLSHSSQKHKIYKKEYYDTYFKKENEGLCKICGAKTKFHGFGRYSIYCSQTCKMKDLEVRDKMKKTCLKNHGVKYSLQSKEIQKKIQQTILDRYGVKNISQCPAIHQKKIDTSISHYGVEYPFQADIVKDKIKEYMINLYGVENPSRCPEIQQKKIDTSIKKYGVEHPSQTNEFQDRRKNTCLEKYGVDNPLKDETIKQKVQNTNLNRYNVKWGLSSKIIQEKGIRTNQKKYGYDYWTQSPKGRQRLRDYHLNRIQKQYNNNEPLWPFIGDEERKCLNELQKYCDFKIKRNPRMIGYFPDGYIKELNLIIEFDERYHFIDNYETYREKDINKNNDYKKYKFNLLRIKKLDWMINQKNVIEIFRKIIQSIT